MTAYWVKTPWWMKKLWSSYTWHIPSAERNIYLTFDDGPHPVATPFVLDVLRKFDAKATFFCIGKNVEAYPGIYSRIIEEGHSVGNHTHHHLNGWKTRNEVYLADIEKAAAYIDSNLFRPPYGRIRSSQAKKIMHPLSEHSSYKVIMWDVLSGDFDTNLSKEKCLANVMTKSKPGSIVVFHDSEKAFSKLEYVLPETLHFFSGKGYQFSKL